MFKTRIQSEVAFNAIKEVFTIYCQGLSKEFREISSTYCKGLTTKEFRDDGYTFAIYDVDGENGTEDLIVEVELFFNDTWAKNGDFYLNGERYTNYLEFYSTLFTTLETLNLKQD